MQERIIDNEITLIPYYPNPDALAWYQDPALCKQVDNIDRVYDAERLDRMYTFLSTHGECYYIRYGSALVGDVTLRDNAELCIVVSTPYQNRHIGRRCIRDMIARAAEKGFPEVRANIYAFNTQSRRMFESLGFAEYAPEWFRYGITRMTDVYVAAIPDPVHCEPVAPQARQEQLDATKNVAVKAQRYVAWITLLKGLKHSRGLDADAAQLQLDANGRWTSAACGISLSHCKTAVASAISDASVGVDLEPEEGARYTEPLLFRIADEEERRAFEAVPPALRLPVIWTRKEAAFKRRAEQPHSALNEDAKDPAIRTVRIRLDRAYILSVACDSDTTLRIFEIDGERIALRDDFEPIRV